MMSEKPNDLWGGSYSARDLVTPRGLLVEQADVLNNLTSGVLHATVESGELDGSVGHVLKIEAPRLARSNSDIVTVVHDAALFPVKVRSDMLGGEVVCNDYDLYALTIKKVLSGDKTRRLVSALISHSNEMERVQRARHATYVVGPDSPDKNTPRPTLVRAN